MKPLLAGKRGHVERDRRSPSSLGDALPKLFLHHEHHAQRHADGREQVRRRPRSELSRALAFAQLRLPSPLPLALDARFALPRIHGFDQIAPQDDVGVHEAEHSERCALRQDRRRQAQPGTACGMERTCFARFLVVSVPATEIGPVHAFTVNDCGP